MAGKGTGKGGIRVNVSEVHISVWDNEKVLEVDGGDAYNSENVFNVTKLYTLNVLNDKFYVYFTTNKWIGILKFSVCVVYLFTSFWFQVVCVFTFQVNFL